MSGPGAGFEYSNRPVAWLKRDVLLFATNIGCSVDELRSLYVQLPIPAPLWIPTHQTPLLQELHPSFQSFSRLSVSPHPNKINSR